MCFTVDAEKKCLEVISDMIFRGQVNPLIKIKCLLARGIFTEVKGDEFTYRYLELYSSFALWFSFDFFCVKNNVCLI